MGRSDVFVLLQPQLRRNRLESDECFSSTCTEFRLKIGRLQLSIVPNMALSTVYSWDNHIDVNYEQFSAIVGVNIACLQQTWLVRHNCAKYRIFLGVYCGKLRTGGRKQGTGEGADIRVTNTSSLTLVSPKQYDRFVSKSTLEEHFLFPVFSRFITIRTRSSRCASNR